MTSRRWSTWYDVRGSNLEPRTSYHVDHRRDVTYWKNVGLAPEEGVA
ncbi:hypothetical protein GS540_28995 [Rhodococcus hoagii]|nr:hypothetical protein [Prescottella equi]